MMRNNNQNGNWGSSKKILFAIVLVFVLNDGSVSCSSESDLYNSTPSPHVYDSANPPYQHSSSQPSPSPAVAPPPPYLYSSPPLPSSPQPNLYKSSPTSSSTPPPPYINISYSSPPSSPSTPTFLHKSPPSSPSQHHYNSAVSGYVYGDPNVYNSPSLTVKAIGKVYCYRSYDWKNPKMSYARKILKGATVQLTCRGGDKDIVAYGTSKRNGKYSVSIHNLNYTKYGGVDCNAELYMSPNGSECNFPTDLHGEKKGVQVKFQPKNHKFLVLQSKSFAYASISPSNDCYPSYYPAVLDVETETGVLVNWTLTSFNTSCYVFPSKISMCKTHKETVRHNMSDSVSYSNDPSNASKPESGFLFLVFIYAIFIVM